MMFDYATATVQVSKQGVIATFPGGRQEVVTKEDLRQWKDMFQRKRDALVAQIAAVTALQDQIQASTVKDKTLPAKQAVFHARKERPYRVEA